MKEYGNNDVFSVLVVFNSAAFLFLLLRILIVVFMASLPFQVASRRGRKSTAIVLKVDGNSNLLVLEMRVM
jgi:hypothetical protein